MYCAKLNLLIKINFSHVFQNPAKSLETGEGFPESYIGRSEPAAGNLV